MNKNHHSQSEQVRALLLEFVDLGRRLKRLKRNSSPDAMSDYYLIMQRIREVADSVVRLSETMDPSDEYLQIFSAAAILASDMTDDPELEKCLMKLSRKVSKRMLE